MRTKKAEQIVDALDDYLRMVREERDDPEFYSGLSDVYRGILIEALSEAPKTT